MYEWVGFNNLGGEGVMRLIHRLSQILNKHANNGHIATQRLEGIDARADVLIVQSDVTVGDTVP